MKTVIEFLSTYAIKSSRLEVAMEFVQHFVAYSISRTDRLRKISIRQLFSCVFKNIHVEII